MKVFFISPNLCVVNSGGTAVAKSFLNMLKFIFKSNVYSFSVNRSPINGAFPIASTKTKIGTALANIQGFCGTLTALGKSQLLEQVQLHQPNLVWLDSSLFGGIIGNIRDCAPHAKIVTYFHNVEVDLIMQRICAGSFHYLPALISTYINETCSAKHSDVVITMTEHDKSQLNKIYGSRIFYKLPIGLKRSSCQSLPSSRSNTVLYVASKFGPNIEGLRFLNNKVAPLLKTKKIIVAGMLSSTDISEELDPRLEIVGFVEDLADLYDQSKASLAPIFSGGGMKIKIADSLMHNRPVIATSFAAIGYEEASSDSILRCESANSFADAIENWIPVDQNSPAADFSKYYSFDVIAEKLENILKL